MHSSKYAVSKFQDNKMDWPMKKELNIQIVGYAWIKQELNFSRWNEV